jgi:hypothetical protein
MKRHHARTRRVGGAPVRKIGPDETLSTVLLIEQLRRKGTTIERVRRWKADPPWYVRLYWATPREEAAFRDWALAMIKRHWPYISARDVQKEWFFWALSMGLHSAYTCPGGCGAKHPVNPEVRAREQAREQQRAALISKAAKS